MRFITAPAVLAVVASVACSSEAPPPALDLASAAQPIFGGQPDADHPEVMFLFDLAGAACTGTNIRSEEGSGFLLTAAHCVTEPNANGDFVPLDPARLVVVPGADFSQADLVFPAEAVSVEPGWDGTFADDDIAVVRFFTGNEPPPPAIEPLDADDDELDQGGELLLIGYGETDQGGLNTERRSVERAVADTSEELVVFSQEDGRGACFGDSGGPGLVEVGNEERVALVISGGVSNEDEEACATGFTLGMRVSAYADFIQDALTD
ncbi:MAG TPA: trypsin-like serine protease [Polyangiaceae bacterium]|nr:trypsin-like serine protease [Polyangiaceae bacterium]